MKKIKILNIIVKIIAITLAIIFFTSYITPIKIYADEDNKEQKMKALKTKMQKKKVMKKQKKMKKMKKVKQEEQT